MTDSAKIRILVADDHGIVRAGVCALLRSEADVEVVGEAEEVDDALRKAVELHPDLVLMDIEMPPGSGIDCIRRICESSSRSRILVLSMHEEPVWIREAIAAGAAGFVAKKAVGSELVGAVRAVHAGRMYVNVSVASPPPQAPGEATPSGRPHADLSGRELEVLDLLAYGFTNQEIATKLYLSSKTVGTYRMRIAEKLGLGSRAEIVRYALEHDLLKKRGS